MSPLKKNHLLSILELKRDMGGILSVFDFSPHVIEVIGGNPKWDSQYIEAKLRKEYEITSVTVKKNVGEQNFKLFFGSYDDYEFALEMVPIIRIDNCFLDFETNQKKTEKKKYCPWDGLVYGEQIRQKEIKLAEILREKCGIYHNTVCFSQCSQTSGFLRSFVFDSASKSGSYIIGLKNEQKIDEIDDFSFLCPNIIAYLSVFSKYLEKIPYDGKISIRSNENGERMVVLITKKKVIGTSYLNDYQTSLYISNGKSSNLVFGNSIIKEVIHNICFNISLKTVFPTNIIAYRDVIKNLCLLYPVYQSRILIDINCGVGIISLESSKYFSKIIGIDFKKSNIEEALSNKSNNNIDNVSFVHSNPVYAIKNSSFVEDPYTVFVLQVFDCCLLSQISQLIANSKASACLIITNHIESHISSIKSAFFDPNSRFIYNHTYGFDTHPHSPTILSIIEFIRK